MISKGVGDTYPTRGLRAASGPRSQDANSTDQEHRDRHKRPRTTRPPRLRCPAHSNCARNIQGPALVVKGVTSSNLKRVAGCPYLKRYSNRRKTADEVPLEEVAQVRRIRRGGRGVSRSKKNTLTGYHTTRPKGHKNGPFRESNPGPSRDRLWAHSYGPNHFLLPPSHPCATFCTATQSRFDFFANFAPRFHSPLTICAPR